MNRYFKASLIHITLAGIIVIAWMFLGCALKTLHPDPFNIAQDKFMKNNPCNEILDVTITVRIRAFGSEAEKQAAWDRVWRSKYPKWGKAAAGVSVSSKIPEIWCDLRMSKQGLVLPQHVIGHEIVHTLWQKDKRVCDPDLLINESLYQ